MDKKPRWKELVEREKNFRADYDLFQEHVKGNEAFFENLQAILESIILDLSKMRGLGEEQILKIIFSRVYNFVVMSNNTFSVFNDNSRLYENVFEACFFTTLCIFIHETKRIKGVSLREFLYKHSPIGYNVKNSQYYFDFNKRDRYHYTSSGYYKLKDEEVTFRKMRNRLLSTRTVYYKQSEWSAMQRSSEHEWAFHYALKNLNDDLVDIYKRIGNLHNDIHEAIRVFKANPEDETHYNRFQCAYKKFLLKLKKINYEKSLKLKKEILSHILEDKSYYGMNIYRFEKKLRLYNIIDEIKSLVECKNEEEEKNIVVKSVILNDIHFPKLYQNFAAFDDPRHTDHYAIIFNSFRNVVVGTSRLVIDYFVESGYLGKWEDIFLDTINKMTESVFYNPEEIDYTVMLGSQEKYIKIISAHVVSRGK
jgi:hypothetical protein